jgi:GAF domain-containing protein
MVSGRTLGVMSVEFPDGDALETLDRGTLGALAEQCAQGLERARLYENEREVAGTLQRSLLPPPPRPSRASRWPCATCPPARA